jgi:hypothetical protein
MHLGARVPNEGARRLAWWIGRQAGFSMTGASIVLRVPLGTLQRLVAGELIPGEELCRPLGIATGEEVQRMDWRRPPQGGWFDEPSSRRLSKVAA